MISRLPQSAEDVLATLLEGQSFPNNDRSFTQKWFDGKFPETFSKSVLVLMTQRGETPEELIELWNAIRKAERTALSFEGNALDTCGTGGDGSHSINLSTLSAIVMAASGVKVLKHGNRAITSRCGSSDLLASFGFNLAMRPKQIAKSADEIGMGYFHAPAVHPVYARFQPLRKSIKTRTFFNLLGPVLNPVKVRYQVLGVSRDSLLKLYAKLMPRLGRKSALIFQGAEGMDEITTLGPTRGLKVSGNKISPWTLDPAKLGFKKGRKSELLVSSVEHAHRKTIALLQKKQKGTERDSVILSAACGIWISGTAKSMGEAVRLATQALDSGRAWTLLNQLVRFSNL